jgi:HPr kinase/phosphorylase
VVGFLVKPRFEEVETVGETDAFPRTVRVSDLLDKMSIQLDLKVLAASSGSDRLLRVSDVNRPGLALAGYLDYFAFDRPQVLGNTETHYMERLDKELLTERLNNIFAYEIPCFVVSRGLVPVPLFLSMAEKKGVPVLGSSYSTPDVMSGIILFLADEFAAEEWVHGVVLDVYGVGVLLIGKPGIGKSETALDLVERGHRLVGDDAIRIKRRRGNLVYAECSSDIGHHMEIRGLGIIDVKNIFGAGAVRDTKRIGLVIELEQWDETRAYDRVGVDEEQHSLLGVTISKRTLPVRPGRNMAVIIEVAALDHRLKEMGEHAARDLDRKLIEQMSRAARFDDD